VLKEAEAAEDEPVAQDKDEVVEGLAEKLAKTGI
jgi:hypothetical protein